MYTEWDGQGMYTEWAVGDILPKEKVGKQKRVVGRRGRPRLRPEDSLKRDMRKASTNSHVWVVLAEDTGTREALSF